jgi:hypothetical protein
LKEVKKIEIVRILKRKVKRETYYIRLFKLSMKCLKKIFKRGKKELLDNVQEKIHRPDEKHLSIMENTRSIREILS